MESKHNRKIGIKGHNLSISEKFRKVLPEGEYEVAFRRWLVRELNLNNLTKAEAISAFNLSGDGILRFWIKTYSDEHELPLPVMTAQEKLELQALKKRNKEFEKKQESDLMHIKALNTLIDIAEEQLNINIRKKSGTKQ
jgi:transposase